MPNANLERRANAAAAFVPNEKLFGRWPEEEEGDEGCAGAEPKESSEGKVAWAPKVKEGGGSGGGDLPPKTGADGAGSPSLAGVACQGMSVVPVHSGALVIPISKVADV